MGSREEPGPNYTEDSSGIPEVVGPVPPLILYNTTFVRWHFTQIQYGGIIQTLHTNICRRSEPSGTKGYQVVLDFSLEVFKNGEARASSVFGLSVLQNTANGLTLDTKQQLGKPIDDIIYAVSKHRLNMLCEILGSSNWVTVSVYIDRVFPVHRSSLLHPRLAVQHNMHADRKLVHQN